MSQWLISYLPQWRLSSLCKRMGSKSVFGKYSHIFIICDMNFYLFMDFKIFTLIIFEISDFAFLKFYASQITRYMVWEAKSMAKLEWIVLVTGTSVTLIIYLGSKPAVFKGGGTGPHFFIEIQIFWSKPKKKLHGEQIWISGTRTYKVIHWSCNWWKGYGCVLSLYFILWRKFIFIHS